MSEPASGEHDSPGSAAVPAAAVPAKRSAFEPAMRLARSDEQPALPARRPAAVVVGTVLIGLRVLAGILWLVSLSVSWDRLLREDYGIGPVPGLDAEDVAAFSDLVLRVVLVAGGAVLVVQAMLAWFVWIGIDWARIVMMSITSLSISAAAVEYFTGGQNITIRTTLLTLALDILVLLALSSRVSRAWSRPGARLRR